MIRKLADGIIEGDVLAKDILSSKGLTVLRKGTVLDNKFIEKIKKLSDNPGGLADDGIYVEGDRGASREIIEKEIALLEKRFEASKDDRLMCDIKEIIKKAIIKNYGGEEENA